MKKYDLYSQAFKADAYATYATIRQENPIMRHVGMDGEYKIWFFSRYEDVKLVLQDHKRFAKDYRSVMTPEQLAQDRQKPRLFQLIDDHLLNRDPPDHTRLRNIVNKAFTIRVVNNLEERVQQIADELLDQVADQGEMDLIDQFAFPLPIIVIAELLGVPAEDRDDFRRWSNAAVSPSFDPAQQEQFMRDMGEFVAYLGQLIAQRRQNPQNDLISRLIEAEAEGDKLSEEEVYSMLFLLLIAGHETTVNLIGNGMLALFQHPDQLDLLKNDLSLMPNAIEELLRYDGPVERALTRWALEDMEINGHQLKRGEAVVAILGSGNRDDAQFEDGEQLDITRQNNRHLAFGHGLHYCLGAPLARLEGRIALTTLLTRLPALQMAAAPSDLTWRLNPTLRGVAHLPVRWS